MTQPMNPSAQHTAMAIRTLINELRHGTVRHPDTADICLTRFEEQLGVGPTVPVEPPVNDWTEVPTPVTVSAACQQFRNRIDDARFGQSDWGACDGLLDLIEAMNGWQRSWAKGPQVEHETETTPYENRARRAAERQGYVLRKSRGLGSYMIVDPGTNTVVYQGSNTAEQGYGLSLQDVEDWLDRQPQK